MENYLLDFNTFVSELVNYHIRMNKDISVALLSEKIGLSNSFVQKALYTPKAKHFNLKHIFLISQALKLSIDKLLPSKENYKLLTNKALTEEEWERFLNVLKKEENEI